MTATADIDIDGAMFISSTGIITSTKNITTSVTGTIYVDGSIITTKDVHNDGSIYNSGSIRSKKYHDDGYTCNSGTIEIDSNQKYDCHGCVLECGGQVIACEFKMHDGNNGDPVVSDVDLCCDDGSDPTFDIQEGTLDSNTVSICGLIINLPIDLLSFNADENERTVRTDWVTKSEINNDYFIVQRSKEGVVFEDIGQIPGAGNSTQILSYEFIDANPYPGTSYYRLKQVDFDGNNETTASVSVFMSGAGIVNFFPNPVTDDANLVLYSEFTMDVSIQLVNMLGQTVMDIDESIENGESTLNLNLRELSSGVYLLKVITPYEMILEKDIIKH